LPRRQPSPPYLELVRAAQAAFVAIEGMRRSCSDQKRRVLFLAGVRLGVALGSLNEHRTVLPADVQQKVDAVLAAASQYFSIDRPVILSRSRVAYVVAARDLVIYLLHHELRLGPAEIGRQLGRDHSSVLTALERTERRARADGLGEPQGCAEVRALLEAGLRSKGRDGSC